MKKTYMMPALQVSEAQAVNMMAVSIQDGNADPGKDVLTKENTDWDFWGDEE
ncbi:MAG: hypothetical protein IJ219_00965 [Bacteroidaceae bacterium]|nr:hypothetical protein [Bacteroidaceae bacterium]